MLSGRLTRPRPGAHPSVIMDTVDVQAGATLRWLRALVLGGVAFVAGLVAHLSSHGLVPGPRALVVLFLLVSAGTACFLGRPASTRRVVLLLMAGQTFIHAGLTALSGHAGDPAVVTSRAVPVTLADPRAVDRSGSLFDQYAAAVPTSADRAQPAVPAWMQHLLADLTGPHAVMALAHLAAAAVVGLWLAAGERALWALLSRAATSLTETLGVLVSLVRAGALPAGPVLPAPQRRTVRAEVARPHVRALATVVARRGPPAALGAVS